MSLWMSALMRSVSISTHRGYLTLGSGANDGGIPAIMDASYSPWHRREPVGLRSRAARRARKAEVRDLNEDMDGFEVISAVSGDARS